VATWLGLVPPWSSARRRGSSLPRGSKVLGVTAVQHCPVPIADHDDGGMTTIGVSRVPRVTVDATVGEATKSMVDSGIGAAMVVDCVGVIGIVTADGVAAGVGDPDRSVLHFLTLEVVRIDPDDDWVTTVHTYQEAATRSVVRRHVGTRSH